MTSARSRGFSLVLGGSEGTLLGDDPAAGYQQRRSSPIVNLVMSASAGRGRVRAVSEGSV